MVVCLHFQHLLLLWMGRPVYMSYILYSFSGQQQLPYHQQQILGVFHHILWLQLDIHEHSIRSVHMCPHLFHCELLLLPDEINCIEPVLHAFTHAPHCLHSFLLILGTFSRIGSDRVVSIFIASYGHASLHKTHPTHFSSDFYLTVCYLHLLHPLDMKRGMVSLRISHIYCDPFYNLPLLL